MEKRKYFLLGFAALAFGVGVTWGVHKYRPFDAIGPFTYYRIGLGMSLNEVEEIVALPPGTHRTKEPHGGMMSAGNWGMEVAKEGISFDPADHDGLRSTEWWGTYNAIYVVVDENDIVVGKRLLEIPW